MIRGGISLTARTDLCIHREGFLTAARNIMNILEIYVIPYALYICPRFILIHNNARPHEARSMHEYLMEVQLDSFLVRIQYGPESYRTCVGQVRTLTSTAHPTPNAHEWPSTGHDSMTYGISYPAWDDGARPSFRLEVVIHSTEAQSTHPIDNACTYLQIYAWIALYTCPHV